VPFSAYEKAEEAFPKGTPRCSLAGGFYKTAIPIPDYSKCTLELE
jgi:hypothetical protein